MAPSNTNPITNFTKALKSSLHFIVYAVWEIIVCTKIAIKHSKNNPNQKDKEPHSVLAPVTFLYIL
jgi:hypothetical protein